MPEHPNDETQLVQQARVNPGAFQELYALYSHRVYGYVASRIGNSHDAEDVVSEIFLRVIKNLDQLRNQRNSSFAAWLFVIARNEVVEYYRRSKNHVPLHVTEPHAPANAQPDQIVMQNQDADQLYKLVITLPERQREIITLRYYGGLRNHEIARVLGIGEKTVSAYISRALSDLQEKYATSKHEAAEDES
jgi:RNA polymerase sigma-70 factor, ECF subfamily